METRRVVSLEDVVLPDAREQAADLGLICSICLGLLQDPVETKCGHLFCAVCLLDDQTMCPTCRTSLPAAESKRHATAAFMRLLAGLRCRCPNGQPAPKRRKPAPAASPCDWTGCYADLMSKHLRACPWEPVVCPRGCDVPGLRRKDLERHLAAECTAGALCDLCGEHVPTCGRAAHEKSAAEQHVEILKQRCYLLQTAQERFSAASPRCLGSWQLQRGAAALQRGASLRTAWARFGHSDWPQTVVARVRFFPRGTEASKAGHCALEIVFEEAPVVVEVAVCVTAAATSRTVRGDSRVDLTRATAVKNFKTTWESFCVLSQEELAGEVRLDVELRHVSVLLRTESLR